MEINYYILNTHEEPGEKNLKVKEDLRYGGDLKLNVMI